MTMDQSTGLHSDAVRAEPPEGWWRARDGQWYPPERRPDPRVVRPQVTVINVKRTITRPDVTGVARRAGIGLAVIAALVVVGSSLRGGEPAVEVMTRTTIRDAVPTTTHASTTTSTVPVTTTIPIAAPAAESPVPVVEPPTTVPSKHPRRSRAASTVAPLSSQDGATSYPGPAETLATEPSAPTAPIAPIDPASPGALASAPPTTPPPTITPTTEPPIAGP